MLRQLARRSPATPSGCPPVAALTVTGGLPYHGGPGSNYCTHALAAMAEVLRQDPGSLGLVAGIGMHMTSHTARLWSTRPGAYVPMAPAGPFPTVPVTGEADGPGRVVTFSTVHNRQGPESTALICDLPDGTRCYARLEDPVPAEDRPVRRYRQPDPGPGRPGRHTAQPVSPDEPNRLTGPMTPGPKRSETHAHPLRAR